ncbi:MAG: putative transcriptional regulator [Actinomycetota bacterium]|jgi:putative transcriptional regulator|nr:putative transcriptional regulator [Actinomycetota bacterium]
MDSLAGKLLIANGDLFDPNFRQTVVLIVDHSDEGALGVVLNRSAGFPAVDALPTLGELLPPESELFIGGPVQPEAGVVLAEFDPPEFAPRLAFGAIGFITGEAELTSLVGVRRARVFAGYSGWGPGQVEEEIAQDAWIIEPAQPDDIFATQPDQLWSSVLRRKGGDYELLATMPSDPSMN